MPAPPLLFMSRPGANNQVYRLDGGVTATQIGPNLTGSEFSSNLWKNNYCAEFRGRIYAVAGVTNGYDLTVFRYDVQANTWTAVFAGSIAQGGIGFSGSHCGLFVASPGGVPTLCYLGGNDGGGQAVLWKTTDGTSWTTITIPSGGVRTTGSGFMFRNVIYFPGNNAAEVVAITVATGAMIVYSVGTMSASSRGGGSFCVFRNRLFHVRWGSGPQMHLWELTGGTWFDHGVLTGSVVSDTGSVNNSHPVIFPVDNTKMVAIYEDGTGGTWYCKACDILPSGSGFTFSNVTGSVIPGAIQSSGASSFQDQGWFVYIDNEAVPATPAISLFRASAPYGGSLSYYEYVEAASPRLTGGGASVSTNMICVSAPAGGGERAWIAGSLGTEYVSIAPSPVLGAVRVTARVWGDTVYGPAGVSGGWRQQVRLATTTALPANTWNSPTAGPGATLTANANGALSVDSVAVIVGDRILVKNESTPARNGIYSVLSTGDGSNPFILIRSVDFDSASITEVAGGAWVLVTAGSTNAGTYWQVTQTAAITMDTTSLTWGSLTPRVLRLRYNVLENTNVSQGTLIGSPTGSQPQATRVGNTITQVIADGVSNVAYDWAAQTDAVPNGQAVVLFSDISVS